MEYFTVCKLDSILRLFYPSHKYPPKKSRAWWQIVKISCIYFGIIYSLAISGKKICGNPCYLSCKKKVSWGEMNLLQRDCVPVPASTNIRSAKLTRLVTQDVRQLLETGPCATETHMQPRITALTGFGVSHSELFIPYPGWLPTRLGSSCLHLAIGIL